MLLEHSLRQVLTKMWRYLARNQRPTSSKAGDTSTQDRDESPSVKQEMHANEDAQEQQQTHATTAETLEEVRRPSVIHARRNKRSDEIKRQSAEENLTKTGKNPSRG